VYRLHSPGICAICIFCDYHSAKVQKSAVKRRLLFWHPAPCTADFTEETGDGTALRGVTYQIILTVVTVLVTAVEPEIAQSVLNCFVLQLHQCLLTDAILM
jgi:hypothetical protein